MNGRQLMRSIVKSPEFLSKKSYRAKVKSPVELVVSAVHLLGGTITDFNTLNLLNRLGQILYEPPSVKGWPNGPGWLSTASQFDRLNFATYLVYGKNGPLQGGEVLWENARSANAKTVAQITDYYIDVLLQDKMAPASRQAILDFAETKGGVKNQTRQIVRMILSSPEFQMA